jgi:hypothetical protein
MDSHQSWYFGEYGLFGGEHILSLGVIEDGWDLVVYSRIFGNADFQRRQRPCQSGTRLKA